MPPHRRYDRQAKAAAVAEAERTSLTATSESSGIPMSTLAYWYDHPDFADVRTKTRDQLAEGSVLLAHIAQGELVRRIRDRSISDQALVAAFGVGVDKAQLLAGMATARNENRDITGSLTDNDVRDALRTADDLTAAGAGRAAEEAPGPSEG